MFGVNIKKLYLCIRFRKGSMFKTKEFIERLKK